MRLAEKDYTEIFNLPMEIKPVIQSKELVYPLVTAVVVGTVFFSGCQQQQQLQNAAPPQVLGGVMK